MRERIRHDLARGLLLQAVVADGRRRVQRLLRVARFEDAPHPFRVMRPDAGEKVGLEIEPHRQAVGLRLAQPDALAVDLVGDAEEIP